MCRKPMMVAQIKDAEQAAELKNGDVVTVEYDSVHGGKQSFTGVVDTINDHNGVGMVELFLRSDADASQRRDCYVDDGTPDRKVEFLMDDVKVESRNGARWNRISEVGTDARMHISK